MMIRKATPEETARLKAEALADPLCHVRKLPDGRLVPTARAIKAADEAARETNQRRNP